MVKKQKRINYKKEIKKALNGEPPYDDGGLFHSGIVLSCQNPIEETTDFDWISKAEIYECLESYLKNRTSDYSNIMFPHPEGCKEVLRRAKYYIQYHLKRDKWEKRLSKEIGHHVEIKGKTGLIRLMADEIDRSVKGFRQRAEKYVASLNLPVKIKRIHLAEYFPPMCEDDLEDERMRDCYRKKTTAEMKRDQQKWEEAMERGEMILSLDSPYKMVKYAGINVEFELPDEVIKDLFES